MDILIKNMEMPKDCEECRFHSKQDVILKGCVVHFCRVQMVGRTYKLHDGCPLVALPEHGRLCDLDALIEHETYNIEQALFDTDEVLEDLKNTPVIVEANNGTDY